ncbi:MAG: type I polyketide synthase, partial [Thermoanaerobaculia bacterium]
EAHGTGTAVGDPQEAEAIGRALGSARPSDDPLPIGSAKTNVGHLESAAGMAGLVKVVLSLKHRGIPASLHFDRPNPNIPFEDLNVGVITEYTPLSDNGVPAVMGVNSFGFGGTNAHVVVQEYSHAARSSNPAFRRRMVPLFLSARCEPALREMAGRYRDLLLGPQAPLPYDVARAAATRRQQHQYRLAVFGRDAAELAERLGSFADGEDGEGVVSGRAVSRNSRLALLFSGNGSQWPGMGRRLLATDRLFRRHVQKVDDLLHPLTGFSILEELKRGPADSRLHLTEIAQPLLFALQVGLFETLVARGLVVEAVLGHSVGEVAAAYAAGAFDLHQAVHVIHERSAAQGLTRGLGRMAAVGLPSADALDEIATFGGAVDLAAVNSPASVTLSGPLSALEELQARLGKRGVFYRILDLDYAFHSRIMDGVREPLLQALAGLEPRELSCAFASTVTGQLVEGRELDAQYWWDNIRSPVRLDEAVARLLEQDFGVFLEVGPHPIMQNYLRENLSGSGSTAQSLATLHRDADDEVRLWQALCGVQVLGCPLDTKKLFRHRGEHVALPLYPWQREFHWHATTNEALGALGQPLEHPLLGHPIQQAEGVWESQLDVERLPYLADHGVGEAVMFPGTGFTEIALAAAEARSGGTSHELESLEFRAPLVFEGTAAKTLRFKLGEDGDFTIRSRPRLSGQPWTLNVVGRLSSPSLRKRPARIDIRRAMKAHPQRVSGDEHYRRTKVVGLSYGPAFRGVQEVWTSGDEVFARLALSGPVADEAAGYLLHPSLLDSCLQVLVELCAPQVDLRRPVCFLPFHIGRMVYYRPGGHAVFCRATIQKRSARSVVAHFQILDDTGETLAELEDFRFRRARLIREGAGVPACYVCRPILRTRPDADIGDFLPHPPALAERLSEKIAGHWHRYDRSDFYDQVLPLMDALVAAFAYRAVHGLADGQRSFTLDSVMSAADIDPRHGPLLSRLLEILREDGLLDRDGSEWTFSEAAELSNPEEIWRLVLADFPGYVVEASVAGRCGMHLPEVLRGAAPEDLLVSKSGVGVTAHLCDASPTWRMANL